MFIPTEDGTYVDSKRIVSWRYQLNWESAVICFDVAGQRLTATVSGSNMSALTDDAVVAVIPAQPQTYILRCWLNDDDIFEVGKTVVLAWSIDERGFPTPITALGMNDNGDSCQPLLMPNGSVDIQYDRQFETYAEWLAQAEAEYREEKAAAKRRAAVIADREAALTEPTSTNP